MIIYFSCVPGLSNFVFRVLVFRHSGVLCFSTSRLVHSQSSTAISDVTSPVKLVGKIRTWFQASSGNSNSANWPGYEAVVANIADMTLWRVGGASILGKTGRTISEARDYSLLA